MENDEIGFFTDGEEEFFDAFDPEGGEVGGQFDVVTYWFDEFGESYIVPGKWFTIGSYKRLTF